MHKAHVLSSSKCVQYINTYDVFQLDTIVLIKLLSVPLAEITMLKFLFFIEYLFYVYFRRIITNVYSSSLKSSTSQESFDENQLTERLYEVGL